MITEQIKRHSWHGRANIENMPEIAAEIERRLKGRRFTVVEYASGSKIAVKTSQSLLSERPTEAWAAEGFGFLDIRTTNGTFHFRTTLHQYDMFSSDDETGVAVELQGGTIRIDSWNGMSVTNLVLALEEDCGE